MLKKVREKLGQLEELGVLRQENKELQESVNDLVELNISITQERTKLREKLENIKQEKLALIEQVRMMHVKLAPRTAVKNRFNELAVPDYWD
jgi:regulator of replication initiation timing